MSGYSTLESAVAGVRAGAFDYLAKPFDLREARSCVDRAFATLQHVETVPLHGGALPTGLIGRTREMLDVYKQIALAADASTAVLVIGESGTGKELVAHAIRDYGRGSARPFVDINCGALAETLLESELFGHVRGSFTGAVADKKGLFEQAAGGTIFLDEISETSPAMQVKLLRVLQENEVRPVGGNRVITTSARVLAASNRDLTEEVAEKRFRQDLYYRLSTFVIRLPPLRSRREDIPMLVAQFLRTACASAEREAQITPGAVDALTAHHWPGNVRELENVVERLVLTSRSGRIDRADVDACLTPVDLPRTQSGFADLPSLDVLEGRYLAHVLKVTNGHRSRAAEILKVDRKTLSRMAARHGLDGD
jgi:DNA-binding NtrC family response regulator